jgi:hypothetical protein
MSSMEEPRLKYRYQYKQEAKAQSVFDDDASKTEIQSYINELLGVKEKPRNKDSLYSV